MRLSPLLPWLVFSAAFGQLPPAVTLDAWNWQPATAPPGSKADGIVIHPDDENTRFMSGADGLWATRDGGKSWVHPTPLPVLFRGIEIDPGNHDRIYAGANNNLFVSTDRGSTWRVLHQFTDSIAAILVSSRDGALYVAPSNSHSVNGVYKSTNQGQTWTSYSFNFTHNNLLCWDIEEDPRTGTLYVGIEIADHPQPYHPPVFRSTDTGVTWQEITGVIPWHVVKLQIDPSNSTVFALTENSGLFRSTDSGANWTKLGNNFSLNLALDPLSPARMFGGGHSAYSIGGVWASGDRGGSFVPVGLQGFTAGSISFNGASTRIYVATEGSGVYVSGPPQVTGNIVYARAGEDAALNCNACSAVFPKPSVLLNGQSLAVTLTANALKFSVPATVAPGQYPIVLNALGTPINLTLNISQPSTPVMTAVTSVLFTQKDAYAPGEVISIFGLGLTSASDSITALNLAPSVPWGTRLASAGILVDGVVTPLQFAFTASATNASQLNFQLPVTLSAGLHTVAVQYPQPDGSAATSNPAALVIKAVSPTYFGNSALPVYLQNVTQDPSGRAFVSRSTPMHPGDVITAYATGLGLTNPPVPAGTAPARLSIVAAIPSSAALVSNSGTQTWGASFLGAVLSPQFPGLYQISFRVPANAVPDPDGSLQVMFTIGRDQQLFPAYYTP